MAINRFSQSTAQSAFPKFTNLWDGTTATSAFDSLGSVALSSNTSSVTFTSIPQTYQHLVIRYFARFTLGSDSGSPSFTFNGDTGTNYSFNQIYGTGATGGGQATGSQSRGSAAQISSDAYSANTFGQGTLEVYDYSSTGKHKTYMSLGGWDDNGSGLVNLRSGAWHNTAAVTSINIFPTASGDWKPYSSFALYGVK